MLPVSENFHMEYFYHILHTYTCQHSLTTGFRTQPFLIDMGLLSSCPACCGQLVKILITVEPYRIFGSNFAYLFILILSIHRGIRNGGGALPSIILAGQCILLKMLISLERHGIF